MPTRRRDVGQFCNDVPRPTICFARLFLMAILPPFIVVASGLVAGLVADAMIRYIPWRLQADFQDYLASYEPEEILELDITGGSPQSLRASIRSPRFWWVILLCLGLVGASLSVFGVSLKGAAAAGLCTTLVALSMIDLEHQLLPDALTLPLLWAGLLINVPGTFASLSLAVVGAAAGYVVLWALYWTFRLLTEKEGMGFGDFKLLAALCAWLGIGHLLPLLLISSVLAAVTTVALIAANRMHRENPFPFGPFLAFAGVVSLFMGQ